jgi:hypothetical protein
MSFSRRLTSLQWATTRPLLRSDKILPVRLAETTMPVKPTGRRGILSVLFSDTYELRLEIDRS